MHERMIINWKCRRYSLDSEIKDILVKLLEGQNRLESDVNGLKTEVGGLKSDVSDLKGEVSGLNMRVSGLETEVKKNSIELEDANRKMDVIAEVQKAHKEQDEMAFRNTDTTIEEESDLLGTALKSVSKDVKEVKENIDVLKDMTGRHEVDINILKRRPV